jgi:hypothetical protein
LAALAAAELDKMGWTCGLIWFRSIFGSEVSEATLKEAESEVLC